MNRIREFFCVAVTAAALLGVSSAEAAFPVDCTFTEGGGDNLTRGFYVSNYQGTSIDRVALAHAGPDGVRTKGAATSSHAGSTSPTTAA